MADAPDERARDPEEDAVADDGESSGDVSGADGAPTPQEIEERYDFEDFGPADMAEMTVEEWESAFDPEAWITGAELLDRVEADLKSRVERREIFAVVERVDLDGRDHVLAYTDAGYATVAPDGRVEGEGSVLQDVEPVVALCSMDDYDAPDMPEGDDLLPHPDEVPEGTGQLGNRLMQVVAAVQVLAGLALLVSPLVVDLAGAGSALLTTAVGLGFLLIGGFLFLLVANARLSDRFRAEEYRDRLRGAGVGSDERPGFVPVGDDDRDADGETT